MGPPYLPIYGIYLPSLTKTFMYHLKTLFQSFLFVTVQAHGAVRVNQYLSCQKYLTEVLSQKNKNKRRKVALPPYLMTAQPSMIDGVRNKSVSKKNINIVGMEDIERSFRSPLTGKLHSQKEIYICFKVASSGTCLFFASSHGF